MDDRTLKLPSDIHNALHSSSCETCIICISRNHELKFYVLLSLMYLYMLSCYQL